MPHDFLQLPYAIEKWVFVVMTGLQFLVRVSVLTVGLAALDVGVQWLGGV